MWERISSTKSWDWETYFPVNLILTLFWVGRKSGSNTYDVNMDDAAILGGRFGYPIEIESKFNLQVL